MNILFLTSYFSSHSTLEVDKWAEKHLQAGEGAPPCTPGRIYLGQRKIRCWHWA